RLHLLVRISQVALPAPREACCAKERIRKIRVTRNTGEPRSSRTARSELPESDSRGSRNKGRRRELGARHQPVPRRIACGRELESGSDRLRSEPDGRLRRESAVRSGADTLVSLIESVLQSRTEENVRR